MTPDIQRVAHRGSYYQQRCLQDVEAQRVGAQEKLASHNSRANQHDAACKHSTGKPGVRCQRGRCSQLCKLKRSPVCTLTATAAQSYDLSLNRVRTDWDSGLDCPARYTANRNSYASEEAHVGGTLTTSL